MRIDQLDSYGKYKFKEPEKLVCPFCKMLFKHKKHQLHCHLNPRNRIDTVNHHHSRGAMLCLCGHPKTYHHTEVDESTGSHQCTGNCQYVDCDCDRYVFDHIGEYIIV